MADGQRPGGLTALAVINFVFAAFQVLGMLGLVLLLFGGDFINKALEESGDVQAQAEIEKIPTHFLWIALAGTAAKLVLLVLSGIGYLKQKRFLGRTLGTAYAVLALALAGLGIVMTEQGFGLGNIIELIYPILTLFLINVTFKDDLVR